MTPEELEHLRLLTFVTPTFAASEMADSPEPRTLIYGYDVDRSTWHVFWDGEQIIRHVYRNSSTGYRTKAWSTESSGHTPDVWEIPDLIPNKRVYWEASDAWFCEMLILRGGYISFTNRNKHEQTRFIGETTPSYSSAQH